MAKGGKRTLGQQIRALREKRGLVQVDLAARCGVREVSISRWERDLEVPRVPNLLALSRVLCCTITLGADGSVQLLEVKMPPGLGMPPEPPALEADRRLPQLKPLRDAVDGMRSLGAVALGEWVREAVELAHALGWPMHPT